LQTKAVVVKVVTMMMDDDGNSILIHQSASLTAQRPIKKLA
jgi:hypothetical protein